MSFRTPAPSSGNRSLSDSLRHHLYSNGNDRNENNNEEYRQAAPPSFPHSSKLSGNHQRMTTPSSIRTPMTQNPTHSLSQSRTYFTPSSTSNSIHSLPSSAFSSSSSSSFPSPPPSSSSSSHLVRNLTRQGYDIVGTMVPTGYHQNDIDNNHTDGVDDNDVVRGRVVNIWDGTGRLTLFSRRWRRWPAWCKSPLGATIFFIVLEILLMLSLRGLSRK